MIVNINTSLVQNKHKSGKIRKINRYKFYNSKYAKSEAFHRQAMLPLFNFLECLAYYALMLNNVICIVKYIELMLKEIVLKKVYTFILKLKKLLFFFKNSFNFSNIYFAFGKFVQWCNYMILLLLYNFIRDLNREQIRTSFEYNSIKTSKATPREVMPMGIVFYASCFHSIQILRFFWLLLWFVR